MIKILKAEFAILIASFAIAIAIEFAFFGKFAEVYYISVQHSVEYGGNIDDAISSSRFRFIIFPVIIFIFLMNIGYFIHFLLGGKISQSETTGESLPLPVPMNEVKSTEPEFFKKNEIEAELIETKSELYKANKKIEELSQIAEENIKKAANATAGFRRIKRKAEQNR